jgi:hypothetical protein
MQGQREIRLAQVAFDHFVSGTFDLGDVRPDFEGVFRIDEGCSFGEKIHGSISLGKD